MDRIEALARAMAEVAFEATASRSSLNPTPDVSALLPYARVIVQAREVLAMLEYDGDNVIGWPRQEYVDSAVAAIDALFSPEAGSVKP